MSAEDRLLDAVPALASRHGYSNLTVETLLSASRVSRSSFYQHFSNIEDCVWGSYRRHADQLLSDVLAAARSSKPGEAPALTSLLDAAIREPQTALFLMREGLAAGPAGLRERDALIARIASALSTPASDRPVFDLPADLLVGAVFRFLAMHLEDDATHDPRQAVLEWAGAFARRSSQHSWSALLSPGISSHPPVRSPWPSKRPTGSSRERIMRATAASIREDSFRAITVSDIVARARVSRRGFYNEFASKADAFMAAYEYGFQQSLAAAAPAFFDSREWRERVWDAAQAFTRFLLREPLISYLGFVECYAAGPGFAGRVHDTQLAFTMFLEDGYRQSAKAGSLSRVCSALTASAIFEAGFQGLRSGSSLQVRRMQPLAVYIALVPFIGRDEAGAFVASKLAAKESGAPAAA
ncbi:MAG TPA: TetR/AcrR family transcriptional regulator [Solirubrobacteraceae bacterium]|nr:TetR/AcrR family transcriptional regulator [Solirubrobacteraceae bacterium]